MWSLGANVFAPIFQGGRLRANVALHDAFRKESVAEYAGAVLRALREVETGLSAEELLELEETHREMEVEQSRAARRLADDRYRRGLDDIVTLLAAQRRAVESEIRLLDLRRRRLDTRVDLLLALGGGFGDAPATPAEEQP